MPQLLPGVDVETIGIIGTAIGAFAGGTFGGIRLGLKKVRGEPETAGRIIGGTIMGSMEMTILSERLRESAEATRESTGVMRELTHQIERLRDKM